MQRLAIGFNFCLFFSRSFILFLSLSLFFFLLNIATTRASFSLKQKGADKGRRETIIPRRTRDKEKIVKKERKILLKENSLYFLFEGTISKTVFFRREESNGRNNRYRAATFVVLSHSVFHSLSFFLCRKWICFPSELQFFTGFTKWIIQKSTPVNSFISLVAFARCKTKMQTRNEQNANSAA